MELRQRPEYFYGDGGAQVVVDAEHLLEIACFYDEADARCALRAAMVLQRCVGRHDKQVVHIDVHVVSAHQVVSITIKQEREAIEIRHDRLPFEHMYEVLVEIEASHSGPIYIRYMVEFSKFG